MNDLLHASLLVARPAPHLTADECSEPQDDPVPAGQTLGLDLVDSMAIAAFPDDLSSVASPSIKRFATDLASEGAMGGAARRAVSRDVAIARFRLRLLESLQASALSRIGEDRHATKDAEALQRMICVEHRRFVAAMEMLRRTERSSPNVSVQINRAQVVVNR